MKADTVSNGPAPVVVANPPSDYLKPVLTPANPSGLPPPPPQGPPGGGPHPPGPELALAVECGPNKAWFYVGRLCQGSKGPCVLFNGAWLTPNEFQYVSGRETAKDWKRSIRHHGKSMKLLMTKGILAISPPSCQCDVCTGCAENNNNLDVNKRAAEIAARKAAAEAAALAEAAGKIASTENETSSSAMADGGLMVVADERQGDSEGSSDQNSPAKESRLTNIIEAIKSKKKKDPSDTSADNLVQKENRPNSRPSSRSGKTKKTKDMPTENGIGSPVQLSPQPLIASGEHGLRPSLSVPVSIVTTPVPVAPTTVVDISPKAAELSPSSPSPSSSYSTITVTSHTNSNKPPLQPMPSGSPSSPIPLSEAQPINEPKNATPESDDSDVEPTEGEAEEDVSRTRAFDWTAWKQKKMESDNRPMKIAASITGSMEDGQRTENNNSYLNASSEPIQHAHSHDENELSGEAGARHMVTTLGINHHWTPSVQVSQSVPQVSVGQDTKPPLLSASRSITTATASITKPIVSIGTGVFSATLPKEQRDGMREIAKDGKDENSKVYAPINWPPVATEVSSKEAKVSTVDSISKSSDVRNGIDARATDTKTHTVASSQASPEKERAPRPPPSSSASEEQKRHGDEQKRTSSPGRKDPPRPDVPTSSNYSEYLRQLGRVPAVPPPGVDDESYVALMRRYYEWYELARLYGPYGLPQGAHPPAGSPAAAGLQRPTLSHPAAGPYDPHALLSSMYHPYYYPTAATAGDPYRSLGTAIPPEWARLGALSEHEREALIARQREQEKEAASSGGSPHGLKRHYPGDEALDLSVNKKQKLAESLAAREGALLYGLQAGFRQPSLPIMGIPGAPAGYPQGIGSLELAAAAYPGLWGLPHSHPGASLSHPLQNSAGIPHPGLSFQHPLTAASRPTTSSAVTSSGSPHNHKDLLQAAHNQSQTLGLAGAWR